MPNRKSQKAQATFEYIIFVAAIIVVMIVFLSPTGPFRRTTEGIMNRTVNQMLSNMVNSVNY